MSIQLPDVDIAVLLDIDGTLIDSVTGPEVLVVDDSLRELVCDLHDGVDGALCFITGRSLEQVDGIFGDLELPTFGLFGLERRVARRGPRTVSSASPGLPAAARQVMQRLATHTGLIFQPKGAVFSVDTRFAVEAKPDVEEALAEVLPILGDDYMVVIGHRICELAPKRAVKGKAIETVMSMPPFRGRFPVFIGDDVPDESGFEYVNGMNGLSIRVNPKGPTAARCTLPGVDDVRLYLQGLLSHCRNRRTDGTSTA